MRSALPRRLRALSIALAALACAVSACRSTDDEPSAASSKREGEIGSDELRELIARGSLRPVPTMEGEDAFEKAVEPGEVEPGDPFEGAERRLADAGQVENAAPAESGLQLPENPYLTFGKRIVVHDDGRITKPYPLRAGTGKKLMDLLVGYGGFPIWDPASGPQGPDSVRVELLPDWDIELYTDLRVVPKDAGQLPLQMPMADWLVVTCSPELLTEVESFVNIFAAGVPQIEIEAKIVEVVTSDSLDVGVKPVSPLTPIFGFPDGTFIESFSFNLPNTVTNDSTLRISSVQDGTEINAILEALSTYENVSIISRPKIAVREGGRAEIVALQRIPFFNVTGLNATGDFGATLTYEEVGIKLYVVPRVIGTETVALNIDVEASQESGSSVTFTIGTGANASELSNPIITRRSAKTIVYLQPGQAVILGGLIVERSVEDQKKVPVLGDIPILGWLFRSTFKSKEQSNVLFFIRPRILTGADMNREF